MPVLPPGVHEHFPADRSKLTPLFKQYTAIKAEHPQALLLYRLGDFYEMFGPDAVTGAQLLGLTLTSRACYQGYKVAMCGVPHHAATRYIKQLVQAGEVVAICEQTEDPAQATGLVERQVTRIITAGTLVEDEYLAADTSNFLAVLTKRGNTYGAALLESSGGLVQLFELPAGDAPTAGGTKQSHPLAPALEMLLRHHPAELLLPQALYEEPAAQAVRTTPGLTCRVYPPLPSDRDMAYFLKRYFKVKSLAPFGLKRAHAAQAALFALIRYLKETFKADKLALSPRLVPVAGQLYLDRRAVAHLELLSNLDPAAPGEGLYGLLNRCHTAGGRRALKQWLLAPSADYEVITQRHDAVEALVTSRDLAKALAELLESLQDVERITNRVVLRRTHPKELRALIDSLPILHQLKAQLRAQPGKQLSALGETISDFSDLHHKLDHLIADDPPVRIDESGIIRSGMDTDCDKLREILSSGKSWFSAYQQSERERTGIRNLKVKHTGAFGYFIEVSKANLALVPSEYERRQTLVNAERFITVKLKDRETEVNTAAERLYTRERELFEQALSAIANMANELANAARAASELDVLLSLAEVATEHQWSRPQLLNEPASAPAESHERLELSAGCHPLVQRDVGDQYYTKNDCYLSPADQQIMLLTGPNMGGKSTYLRMIAATAILNQLGGFVPAQHACLPIFDRIYTRVGAQDYLSHGQSTFMVEMLETAEILNTCGSRSLILLDEVGRGTSTYDGISIAKAVIEYLHEHPARPFTLFATHFFELTDLSVVLPRLRNYHVEVARDKGQFVFLYKVSPGAASDSFGVEVAAMAGLPAAVVTRARDVLRELESVQAEARQRARRALQLGLFKQC